MRRSAEIRPISGENYHATTANHQRETGRRICSQPAPEAEDPEEGAARTLRAGTHDRSPRHRWSGRRRRRGSRRHAFRRRVQKRQETPKKPFYVHACLGKHLAFRSTFIFPSGQSATGCIWCCSGHHKANAQNGWCDHVPKRDGLDAVLGSNPAAPPEAGPWTHEQQRAGLGHRVWALSTSALAVSPTTWEELGTEGKESKTSSNPSQTRPRADLGLQGLLTKRIRDGGGCIVTKSCPTFL